MNPAGPSQQQGQLGWRDARICTQAARSEARSKIVRRVADTSRVEYPVWSFVRGSDRLDIGRQEVDDGVMLIVAGFGTPRSYFFRDRDRLDVFQRDMETLLLKTGWAFDRFVPEHRDVADRRGWPRKSNDRRRWWTAGARVPRQPKLKDEAFKEPLREETAAPHPKETRST